MNRVLTIGVFLVLSIQPAGGQQTIFNVPTTDVLDKGKVYTEVDASFKPNDQDGLSKFSSFVPRIVVGVGGNVEVGLNVVGNIQPGADSTALVLTIKWKFYQNAKKDLALIAGTNVFIPVRNRAYYVGSYSYLGGSKTFDKTRLTAAGYVASKNVFAADAVRVGGQFGVEQTVNAKVTLAGDWITGKHSSGYFTPGVIYKPHPKVTTYWGYSIGNADATRGNNFFLVEFGYNFN
ncbi:MAG: hypothetical protein ABI999_05395 [Acidobacteriota bacterium]